MASTAPAAFMIEVRFEPRDDGGLRALCDKVPNFLLSHSDPQLVRLDVIPALKVILSDMFGMPMDVRELSEIGQQDGSAPVMPAHLCGRQNYVGLSKAN
jgi:hypothetical protein